MTIKTKTYAFTISNMYTQQTTWVRMTSFLTTPLIF